MGAEATGICGRGLPTFERHPPVAVDERHVEVCLENRESSCCREMRSEVHKVTRARRLSIVAAGHCSEAWRC